MAFEGYGDGGVEKITQPDLFENEESTVLYAIAGVLAGDDSNLPGDGDIHDLEKEGQRPIIF